MPPTEKPPEQPDPDKEPATPDPWIFVGENPDHSDGAITPPSKFKIPEQFADAPTEPTPTAEATPSEAEQARVTEATVPEGRFGVLALRRNIAGRRLRWAERSQTKHTTTASVHSLTQGPITLLQQRRARREGLKRKAMNVARLEQDIQRGRLNVGSGLRTAEGFTRPDAAEPMSRSLRRARSKAAHMEHHLQEEVREIHRHLEESTSGGSRHGRKNAARLERANQRVANRTRTVQHLNNLIANRATGTNPGHADRSRGAVAGIRAFGHERMATHGHRKQAAMVRRADLYDQVADHITHSLDHGHNTDYVTTESRGRGVLSPQGLAERFTVRMANRELKRALDIANRKIGPKWSVDAKLVRRKAQKLHRKATRYRQPHLVTPTRGQRITIMDLRDSSRRVSGPAVGSGQSAPDEHDTRVRGLRLRQRNLRNTASTTVSRPAFEEPPKMESLPVFEGDLGITQAVLEAQKKKLRALHPVHQQLDYDETKEFIDNLTEILTKIQHAKIAGGHVDMAQQALRNVSRGIPPTPDSTVTAGNDDLTVDRLALTDLINKTKIDLRQQEPGSEKYEQIKRTLEIHRHELDKIKPGSYDAARVRHGVEGSLPQLVKQEAAGLRDRANPAAAEADGLSAAEISEYEAEARRLTLRKLFQDILINEKWMNDWQSIDGMSGLRPDREYLVKKWQTDEDYIWLRELRFSDDDLKIPDDPEPIETFENRQQLESAIADIDQEIEKLEAWNSGKGRFHNRDGHGDPRNEMPRVSQLNLYKSIRGGYQKKAKELDESSRESLEAQLASLQTQLDSARKDYGRSAAERNEETVRIRGQIDAAEAALRELPPEPPKIKEKANK